MSDRETWIVVSGGGGALGSALAKHYAGKGRRVLALDQRFDHNRLEGGSERIVTRQVELTSHAEVGACLDEIVGDRAAISLLVNAVGRIWNEPILSFHAGKLAVHGSETWQSAIAANLTAPFVVASEVAARMVRRGGGAIVNFSSIASAGNAGQAAYSAAKAGIEGLTRTMAAELGPLGVRVNAVSLGFIDVESTRGALSEQQLQDYAKRTPVGRLGRLEDVIGAVEFLETTAFANGTILQIDGGLRL